MFWFAFTIGHWMCQLALMRKTHNSERANVVCCELSIYFAWVCIQIHYSMNGIAEVSTCSPNEMNGASVGALFTHTHIHAQHTRSCIHFVPPSWLATYRRYSPHSLNLGVCAARSVPPTQLRNADADEYRCAEYHRYMRNTEPASACTLCYHSNQKWQHSTYIFIYFYLCAHYISNKIDKFRNFCQPLIIRFGWVMERSHSPDINKWMQTNIHDFY